MPTILVVEDDDLLGKSLSDKLEHEGYNVFWAQSGQEALEALENQDIGLVYLDIMLGGDMDGFDVLRKMKQDDLFKKIHVVILSNLGEMGHIDRAMEMGANDYIVKITASLDSLIQIADKQLTLKRIEDQGGEES